MKENRIYSFSASISNWLLMPHGPLRILGTIAIAVFIGETLVMLLIALLPPMTIMTEAIVDSSLLIVVISPALYLFLFRPIIRHVRHRESAERNVRKSRDLLQTVFNGISDPLILLDNQMKVKMINTAASHYYHLGDNLAIDQPCHQVLMAKDQPCAECDLPRRIAGNSAITFERKGLFDPNRIEQVVVYRSVDQGGHSGSAIVKITDVTDARALERQVRQRERLASLGLLISGVAHEINNPNTFISFNLPILKEYLDEVVPIIDQYAGRRADFEVANMPYGEFRQDLFKLIANITHGSRRIDIIVSQLKAYSRIQDAQKLAAADIRSVLNRVATLANSQIKRMVKRFDMNVPAELPEIVTDSNAIEQMVLNLLINACQAADKSDSWVRLKAYMITDKPDTLCIEIADNGCGMDDETLGRIFDPLFTTKGPDTGTGLGLYICHNLVEGLGGTIAVKTTLGEGSTFQVFIPDLKSHSTKTPESVEYVNPSV